MKRWNQADRLLAGVALLFCLSLGIKLKFPGAFFAEGLFFCSEAALVGGIADWFAVTALFEKPLGFPWHTALVPRKREKFIVACVKMVQDEFFSKKKLLLRIKKLNLLNLLMEWIERNRGKELLTGLILERAEAAIDRIDTAPLAELVNEEIKKGIRGISEEKLCRLVGRWISENQKDEDFLNYAILNLRSKLEGENGRRRLRAYLENFGELQNKSIISSFITFAAQLSNIINFDEASEVLQKQLLRFTEDLMQAEHPLRLRLLFQFRETAAELSGDESWQEVIREWKHGISETIDFKPQIMQFAAKLRRTMKRNGPLPQSGALALQSPLARLVAGEIDRSIEMLKTDPSIRQATEEYLYDLAGRSVLQAQAMIGVIVQEVLKELSDAELNRLIYSKIEQDLLWIRMNGSIVGAVVGFGIFLGLYCIR